MSDQFGHIFKNGRCRCGASENTDEANEICELSHEYESLTPSPEQPTVPPSQELLRPPVTHLHSQSSETDTTMPPTDQPAPTQQNNPNNITLPNITDIDGLAAAVAQYQAQNFRIIAVAGMRGSGKTVFLIRLIDALTIVEGLRPPPDSISFRRLNELRTQKVLDRTDERSFLFYSMLQPPNSNSPSIVFIDFSGEHFAPEKLNTADREKTLSFLRHCHAYVVLYPLDELDTYTNDDNFHRNNINQMFSSFIGACETDQRNDKPLAVVYAKADIYRNELNPYDKKNEDDFDVLALSQDHFRSYKLTLSFFTHVRFCFISTGKWTYHEDENGIRSQSLKNPDEPSYGLLDVYDFIKDAPPEGLMRTQEMIEKYAWLLTMLAKIPFFGHRVFRH